MKININTFLKHKTPEEIIITLHDNNKTIIMKANKQTLCDKLVYFQKAFSFKENTLQYFKIEVPNACIVHDIILDCRNPNWNINILPKLTISSYSLCRYTLEYWKCCDFLCLSFHEQLLFDLDFTIEDYDLLVNIIDLFGYTKNKIWLMNNLLPPEYDLSKFPKELIKNMIKYSRDYLFIGRTKIWKSSSLYNSYGSELFVTSNEQIINMSHDSKNVITISEKFLKVYDLKSGKILYIKKLAFNMRFIDFTNNSNILISVHQNYIYMFSIVDESYYRSLFFRNSIIAFACSPDGKYFAVIVQKCFGEFDESVEIYESDTLNKIFVSHNAKIKLAKSIHTPINIMSFTYPLHNIENIFSIDSQKIIEFRNCAIA